MTPNPDGMAAVLRGNPFSGTRVTRHGPPTPDVPAIHDASYRELLALAERACAENIGVGVTVWGEPGIGKSHLLRRFERWSAESGRAVLVSPMSLQVPAPDLPRSLLRDLIATISQCAAGRWNETILFRLLEQFLRNPNPNQDAPRPPAGSLQDHTRRAMAELARCVPGATMTDPVVTVLFRFFRSGYAAWSTRGDDGAAVVILRWLSGDQITAEEAFDLGLHERDAVLSDAHILRAIAILAQFARAAGRTLVLCFDQIHTLRHPYVIALSRVLHELLDCCGNLLVVLSEVQDEMVRMTREFVITPAAWDRLGENLITLNRLGPLQIRPLIEFRLNAYLSQFANDAAVGEAIRGDPLFPLGSPWWDADLGKRIDVSPRRAIQLARDRWLQLQQNPAAPVESGNATAPPAARGVDEIVDDAVAARATVARALPPNADNIMGLVRECLERCVHGPPNCRVELIDFPTNLPRPFTYHGRVRIRTAGRPIVIGLTATTATHATSAAVTLRHLAEDSAPPDRVVLVTDSRVGLAMGSQPNAQGRVYLKQLEDRSSAGFCHVSLTADQYAELDAFAHVMSHADDLDVPGSTRHEKEAAVVESLLRRGRFRAHALLCQLLSDSSGAPADMSAVPTADAVRADDCMIVGAIPDGATVRIPIRHLVTHVSVVGAAGSGKTWMAKVLAEEAILHGVPVLAIDPQGDLVQMLKTVPSDDPRAKRFAALDEPRILTPGSDHGVRVSLDPLRLPAAGGDPADLADLLETTALNLVAMAGAGGEVANQTTFVIRLLRRLMEVRGPRTVSLDGVAAAVHDPESIGLENPETYVKKAERERLGRNLQTLMHGPAARLFTGGAALDLDWLIAPTQPGRIPLNVVYLNALPDDGMKQTFVAALAVEIYRWMVANGGRSTPRLLVYLDEARDYLPASTLQPPAKKPLLRLFAQGRKFGVCCLTCTQSPRSVWHETFGNSSTKFIGRLESAHDVERVREWFASAGGAPPWLAGRTAAGAGNFVARWPDMPPECDGRSLIGRKLYTLHEGAWSAARIEQELQAADHR